MFLTDVMQMQAEGCGNNIVKRESGVIGLSLAGSFFDYGVFDKILVFVDSLYESLFGINHFGFMRFCSEN